MTTTSLFDRVSSSDFGHFIKRFFPNEKIQKITLNVATTCPNRDGNKGRGGCTYCNNKAFSPAFANAQDSISEQLKKGIEFFRYKYPSMRYLAYFQTYTSTYGRSIQELITLYEEALQHPLVVGIVIGTRPDCMPQELLKYLSELSKKVFVLVEYGVESTCNRSLERVKRGHTWEQSQEVIIETARRGILVGAHLILGLPQESYQEMLSHAENLSTLPLSLLKVHQLQIVAQTPMALEYASHPEEFQFFTPEEYADLCLDFLEHLSPHITVDRFVSQTPPELLIAPRWELKNYAFTALLKKKAIQREKASL
ncbi:TIGR01212 family radical SAM protein [Porphyromonas circumdentaria]|uniref:TIGR01212 family radical SAM protein n=1 Tax=Porphyromonas circumdentaria TaxID=29524 RepID=UPI0026DC5FCA|nr:TIGR01212 family radical SAM protein [Porphyromonas circumdentaria]MDO4722706.1 TIGR01212 family radical SAM protein [Porphyromonas circumdentaria]